MRNIVISGCSGHAKVVADIVEKQGLYHIAGFLDTFLRPGDRFLDYGVLGSEEDLEIIINRLGVTGIIIGTGDACLRAKIASNITDAAPSLEFLSAIHPAACLGKGASVGAGSIVMAGAVINPYSRIGRFCVVNTHASLDHDSVMEDFSGLGPRATTGGDCRIGQFSYVGIGATLIHGVSIGEDSVVGAGSVVVDDIPPGSLAYGVPARVIRPRVRTDKYL